MKKLFLIITCALCIVHYALSQAAMGSWTTHISYSNINNITQSNQKIFGLSAGALFSIDKEDLIIETYSKTYGLNDNNINLIKYSDFNNILLIAYKNSNIDLMTDDSNIINITDLYRKSMSGSKIINDICFDNEYAYLACDFGIAKLNLNKKEFTETYYIGTTGDIERVINIDIADKKIYALTNNNISVGNTKDNLLNYKNWTLIPDPDSKNTNIKMVIFNDTIYLLKKNNILYQYSNNTWKQYKSSIKNVSENNNILFLATTNNHLSMIVNGTETPIYEDAFDALKDNNHDIIWFINKLKVYAKNTQTEDINYFTPNGPLSNTHWKLKYSDGRIFSVPGGRASANYYTLATLSFFENGTWHNYNNEYFPSSPPKKSYDLVDIAINPNDKTNFWVASYGLGLYEFRNDELYKFHHCDNSGLNSIFPEGDRFNYIRTDGMTYDDQGNLWILNNAGSIVKYIDPNGQYHNLQYTFEAATTQDILINNKNSNQKIVLIPRHTGSYNSLLFTFDTNGTLDNINDDKTASFTKVYDQDNKELVFTTSPLLRSIAQDKNGVIWIGTTQGLFLINDPAKMFDDNFRVYRIKIPRNDGTGLADYLLDTEEIKAIAVDGANRKWIGTASSGIYLVSEDGLETIHHFTSENSPLLSDAIQSIAINEKTGEVFIGTGNGLISYQSDAIEGGNIFENVRAYPNPVRPEYNGLITITGLVADTQIRITDVNGNIVFETRSNGGVATWDGCNISGERVATGVYFAHCVSPNGKQKQITKILIIK